MRGDSIVLGEHEYIAGDRQGRSGDDRCRREPVDGEKQQDADTDKERVQHKFAAGEPSGDLDTLG